MDISGIKYIADQIVGHSRAFKATVNKYILQRKEELKAEYPSVYNKPCKLRIYEEGDHFYLMGQLPNKKNIRLAIHRGPLKESIFHDTRKKGVKRFKASLSGRLPYQNLLVVDPGRPDKKSITLQTALYLYHDGLADKEVFYQALTAFSGSNDFPTNTLERLQTFSIPPTAKALRSFMHFISMGERAQNDETRENSKEAFDGKERFDAHVRVYNRKYFTDKMNNEIPRTTVYAWINTGKLAPKRSNWRYEKSEDFLDKITDLNRALTEKKALALMAKRLTPAGQKIKSTQRRLQRLRKKGLSLKEIGEKVGYSFRRKQ